MLLEEDCAEVTEALALEATAPEVAGEWDVAVLLVGVAEEPA